MRSRKCSISSTRPIWAASPKGDYTELAIRERIAGQRTVRPRHISKKAPPKIGLLIDIEAAMRSGKGPGYVRWAKVFNLKQLSQAVIYLKEHGDMDYAELQENYAELLTEKRKVYADYKQARSDMRELYNIRANVESLLELSSHQEAEKKTQKSRV